MTPTKVYSVRLDPSEVVGCIDVCRAVGVEIVPGFSVSMAVRAAITALVYSAREAGSIPEYDPYKYADVVRELRPTGRARKAQVGQTIALAEKLRAAADMPSVFARAVPAPQQDEPPEVVRARALKMIEEDQRADPKGFAERNTRVDPRVHRLRELQFRAEQDPANVSKAEFREMKKLQRELGANV